MKNSIKNTLCSFYFCFLLLLIGTLAACKSNSVPLSTKTEVNTITTKVIVTDTVFLTKKDSSYYSAWLECIDGKVKIKGIPTLTPGKNLKPPNVDIKDNELKVDCKAEAEKLFASWKDYYILENRQGEIRVPYEVERKISFWEKLQIYCGRLFLVLVLYYIVKILIKIYKPI